MRNSTLWDTKTVVRRVKVNRGQTLQASLGVLESAGKKLIIDDPDVMFSFPSGKDEKDEEGTEVVFFHLIGHRATEEEVSVQRIVLELIEDPYSHLAVNEADPSFASGYDNTIIWKDGNGRSCHLSIVSDPESNEQYVFVGHKPNKYWFGTSFGGWWFSGIRKSS